MAVVMAPELTHASRDDEMDINDLMANSKGPVNEGSERRQPRFRPRPTNSSAARPIRPPERRHSEKQLSQRRQRQRINSAAITSSPKKHSSTLTKRKKTLSTMDARSVASADDWGGGSSSNNSCSLSYTDMLRQKSFRDVVGGDRHADEVLASHGRKVESLIREQKVKEGRRNNVKNSLATFLQANNPDDDSITVEDEEEEIAEEAEDIEVDDEHLISDAEQEENEMDFRDSPSNRSPKQPTPKKNDSLGSKSSRRVTRTMRTLDKEQPGGAGDGAGGSNSNHSRKSVARPNRKGSQRVKSKGCGDEEDATKSRSHSASRMSNRRVHRVRRNTAESADEASVVDSSSRRSRRGSSRVRSAADDADDRSVTSSHRNRTTASRPRSVDASVRRQRSRSRGGDQQRMSQRRRSQSRSKGDDDEKSVSSKVSHATASRRGRRPGKGPQAKKNLLPPSQAKVNRVEQEKSSTAPPSSPENNKDYLSRSMPSLACHFDSQRAQERKVDADVVSEASSSHFSSATPQSTLLQFDPTSEDLIQAVNQKGAKKTSETFKHADGTESKLQISELAGLPTFEKSLSAEELLSLNASSQSLDISVANSKDEEDIQKPKLNIRPHLRATAFRKPTSNMPVQNPGDTPVEPVRRAPRATKSSSALEGSGPPNRGGNMQGHMSMSFMQRVQNRKAQFAESMMNRSRVGGLDHQALLEDEGSEHD